MLLTCLTGVLAGDRLGLLVSSGNDKLFYVLG